MSTLAELKPDPAPEEKLTPGGVLELDGSYVAPPPTIPDAEARRFSWLDVVWLLFLLGLALLPPRWELHKQLLLLAIGLVQVLEGRLIRSMPNRGAAYAVLLKIAFATALIDHTGELGINSSYFPVYYVPVVTAALYFGPLGTMLWTLLASAAYCSYLIPALQDYTLTPTGIQQLTLRIMFFFLAAMLVNRFAQESRRQTRLYQELAERLAETNRQLERAQAEARRSERLAALGQLSAGLAHEIRNPLAVIKGSAEMLNQKLSASDALARELADYISSEVNRLSALVSEFLDFARPLHAELHPTDIRALLDRVLQTVAERWTGQPVKVERRYATGIGPIPLDESLCEQALLNLVQNAYEAMEEHGGKLTAELRQVLAHERSGIEIHLTDTGPGVPDTMREQIFNPFVTTKKNGVGLGLSIVSKIVDGHGGSIRVDKGPQGGATFTLFFPLKEAVESNSVVVIAG